MTEYLADWILGITCAALLVAAVGALVHGGAARRVLRLTGGLVIVLAAVTPAIRLEELSDGVLREYSGETAALEEELLERNQMLYQTIIEGNVAAYILDKAAELGLSCRAEAVCSPNEDGMWSVARVTVFCDWTEEERQLVSGHLEKELNVPFDRQFYEREEP